MKLLLPLWGKLFPTSAPGSWSLCTSVLPWPYCLDFPSMYYKWCLQFDKMYLKLVLIALCINSWFFLSLSTILLYGYTTVCSSFLWLKNSVVFSFRWFWKKLPQVSVYGFSYQYFLFLLFVNTWYYLVHVNKFEILSEINSAHCIMQKRSHLDSCS